VLIKAAAGGGGRGMRLVAAETALSDALDAARNEALSAFGNGRLIVEKYLERPRHVEVQVFGDQRSMWFICSNAIARRSAGTRR